MAKTVLPFPQLLTYFAPVLWTIIPTYLYFTSHVGIKVPCRFGYPHIQPVSELITRAPRGKGNRHDLVLKLRINQIDELLLALSVSLSVSRPHR